MDQIIRRIPHLLSATNQNFTKRIEWRSWLSSRSTPPNISSLFKPDGKVDYISDKEDPFQSLLSNLIHNNHVPTASLNELKSCRTQLVGDNFSRYDFYKQFIECIDKQDTDFNSEKSNNIIENLSKTLHLLSDEQLINIIDYLNIIPGKSSLTLKLDEECCKRSTKWGKDFYIRVAWSFFQLKSSNHALYLQKKIVLDLADEVQQMTPQELVMYLVILKQFRKFPKTVNKLHIEYKISEVLDSLSIEDLGLVCSAFFECNEAIKSLELVGRLVERLLISASSTDDKTVGSMLKLFRKSSSDPGHYAKQVLDIQPMLCNLVPNWNLKVLIQLIAVCSSLLFYHPVTIERVTQKFLICMKEARLKDLERLSMVIAMSTYQSPSTELFWDALGEEFTRKERKDEIYQYPHSFISLTNYAVVANHYSEQLLRIALSQDFLNQSKSYAEKFLYQSTKRELLNIDCSLGIERPEYCGPRLSPSDAKAFEKLYRKPLPNMDDPSLLKRHDSFLISLLNTVRDILGEKNRASLVYLQPHFTTPDIVFSLDGQEMKKFFALSKENCVQRCVLVGGSRNMYSRLSDQPMGPLRMKIRQLQSLGWNVILIPWNEFYNASKRDRLGGLALLNKKIRETLKKI